MSTETTMTEAIAENTNVAREAAMELFGIKEPASGVQTILPNTGSTFYSNAKKGNKVKKKITVGRMTYTQREIDKNIWVIENNYGWYISSRCLMTLLDVSDTYLANVVNKHLHGNTSLCLAMPGVPYEIGGSKKNAQMMWSKTGLKWLVNDIMIPSFRLVNKLKTRLAYIREHYKEFDFIYKNDSVSSQQAVPHRPETVARSFPVPLPHATTSGSDTIDYVSVAPSFYMDAIREHITNLENQLVEKNNELTKLRQALAEKGSSQIMSYSQIFSIKGAGMSTEELEKRGFVGVDKLYYNFDNLWLDPATSKPVGLQEFRAVFRHTFHTENSTHTMPAVRAIAREREIADVFHVFCGKHPNPVDDKGNATRLNTPAFVSSSDPHIRPQVLYYVPNATNLNWKEMLHRYREPIPM